MQISSIFRSTLQIALICFSSQITFANDDLTSAEKNTLVKEDVASMQVLQDYCPTIIGKNAKFDQNITTLINEYLSEYSENITLQKLQIDSEYQNILKATKKSLQDTSKEDNQFACEELISIDM